MLCDYNMERSPIAVALILANMPKGLSGKFDLSSAGIYGSHEEKYVRQYIDKDPILRSHAKRIVTAQDIEEADTIFVMTKYQKEQILKKYPNAKGKIYLLLGREELDTGIGDYPEHDKLYLPSARPYRAVREKIENKLNSIYGRMKRLLNKRSNMPAAIGLIDKLFRDVNVKSGATVLVSENLFIENGDRMKLEGEIKVALQSALNSGAIAILSLEDIRTRVKRNSSKDKLAVVLARDDYESNEVWKSDDERTSARASVLILDDKLTGTNYLYLQGVIGLARAIMANNKQAISYYYNLLSGTAINDDILKLLDGEIWNNIAFAIKAVLRFKDPGRMDPEELRANIIRMETLLIAA
jgi:protein-tyrosine phosphatase